MRGRPSGRPHDLDTVLDAAVGEFLRRGYDATRMENIAEATGLSKSSIYHHVTGKEDLLRRGLDKALAGLEETFAQVDARRGSPAPAVAQLVELVVRDMLRPARLPYVSLLVGVRGNSEVELAALERRRRFDRRLADLLRRGQEAGVIRSDIPPLLLARLAFGTINSLQSWAQASRDTTQVSQAAVAYVLAGLHLEDRRRDRPVRPTRPSVRP